MMEKLGWYYEVHSLVNFGKKEGRFHKDGSEITEDQVNEIVNSIEGYYG